MTHRPELDLRGVLPPITTPFDADGGLDIEGLERNLERYEASDLAGYLVFGSNGEAVHLDPGERATVLETVRRRTSKLVVAGVNALSTRDAVGQARQAAELGADAALVVTPYFYKGGMTHDVLRDFYLEVADAAPLPVLIYNVPQNTGVVIHPATIAELSRHDRIVGVKDSSGHFGALADTVRSSSDDFRVFAGNAAVFYPALAIGAAGAVLAVACIRPDECVALYEAVRRGDHDRARDLQQRLAPLGDLVTRDLGIPGLKAALDALGFVGGPPRGPLRPLAGADRRRLLAGLQTED